MEGFPPEAKKWHTREDSGIRLDRSLRWWHDDQLVEHPRIIETFNQSLVPTDDGRFQLQIGKDWCFVAVEDAAYAVTAIDAMDDGGLSVRLSDRTAERLAPDTLQLGDDGVLQCRVKAGRARARFARDAQFELGSLLVPEGTRLYLELTGRRVPTPLTAP